MDSKIKNLAFGVAALLATSMTPAFADDATKAGHSGEVECHGANACKGQGNCKSAENSCKHENSCKGKGWVWTSTDKCAATGGKIRNPASK